MSGSWNYTKDFVVPATAIAPVIGDFLNTTWESLTLTAMTGLGMYTGASRTYAINSVSLTDTLVQYTADNSTGDINQTYVLSNGPVQFGSATAGLSSYVQTLELASNDSMSSTVTWNTLFCATDIVLFEGFFQKLHQPPLDALGNTTAAQASAAASMSMALVSSVSAYAQSLASAAASASSVAVALTSTAMPPPITGSMGGVTTVTVTAMPTTS